MTGLLAVLSSMATAIRDDTARSGPLAQPRALPQYTDPCRWTHITPPHPGQVQRTRSRATNSSSLSSRMFARFSSMLMPYFVR